jgi:hypothetical protein
MTTGRSMDDGESDFDWSWSDEDPTWMPPDIDITKPSPARMYDYALGGKDNFEVDRRAVEQVATVLPDFRHLAQLNRLFLKNAVQILCEAGITQFIDIGTGIPTSPNVHELARQVHPHAKVVYVDNDPIVMAHNRALRAKVDGVITVQHDAREPDTIIRDPAVRQLIDFNQPVGLLFIAVLHFVRRDLAADALTRFRQSVPSGSYIAISTACTDGMNPAVISKVESVYQNAAAQIFFRTGAQIEQLFEGLELVEPGLKDITKWRVDEPTPEIHVTAGIGRKP